MTEIGSAYCYHCQRPIQGEEVFCRHCGSRLQDTGIQPGQRIGRHYVVEKVIGHGGMGQVVKATHDLTHQVVAIKTLSPHLATDPGLRERFLQEARALAGLDHPNIMTLHTFFEEDGKLYLVMQYVDGQDLDAMFRRCGGLSAPATLPIFWRSLQGLGYAHRQGIIHRDLKPANILLTKNGRVILTDFGIARIHGGLRLTMTGAQVGTVFYMSPEQIQGAEAEARSDIYAMGVSLYEVLTGRLPFDGDDYNVRKGHVESPAPDPRRWRPHLPVELVTVLMRALAKDPDDRFQTAEAFADALGPPGEVLPLVACPLCHSQHPIGEGLTCPGCGKEEICRFHMVAGEGVCQPCFQADNYAPTLLQETLVHEEYASSIAETPTSSNPAYNTSDRIDKELPEPVSAPSASSAPGGISKAKARAQERNSSLERPVEVPLSSLGLSVPGSAAPSSARVEELLNATPSSHTLPPQIVTRDGAEMVLVPGGLFTLGDLREVDAQPCIEVHLRPYYIDRYPVTNACYLRFLRETGYAPPEHWWSPDEHEGNYFPPDFTLHPIVQISHDDAQAYCRWAGKRLPTEAEWEKAARSVDRRPYPWGMEWRDHMAHFAQNATSSVLRYPQSQSPYGACDMLGNVWEWVADFYASDSYRHITGSDPQGVEQSAYRVVRGGSFRDPPHMVFTFSRGFRMPELTSPDVGFRCVLDLSELQQS